MKTHVILKFEYEDTTRKTLISTVRFPIVIRDVKYIELADYSPSAVLFMFSCDILDHFFSNTEDEPVLAFRLSGTGETEKRPIDQSKSNVRDLTVRMFHRDRALIHHNRQKQARAHLILHHGDLRVKEIASMKTTFFLLNLVSTDETDKVHAVNYKLPVPIYNAKWIKVINWFASGEKTMSLRVWLSRRLRMIIKSRIQSLHLALVAFQRHMNQCD